MGVSLQAPGRQRPQPAPAARARQLARYWNNLTAFPPLVCSPHGVSGPAVRVARIRFFEFLVDPPPINPAPPHRQAPARRFKRVNPCNHVINKRTSCPLPHTTIFTGFCRCIFFTVNSKKGSPSFRIFQPHLLPAIAKHHFLGPGPRTRIIQPSAFASPTVMQSPPSLIFDLLKDKPVEVRTEVNDVEGSPVFS